MSRQARVAPLVFATVALLFAPQNLTLAASTLWTYKSPTDIKWHQLTDVSTLLVGTDDGITAFDPEKGTVGLGLWGGSFQPFRRTLKSPPGAKVI